MIDSDNTQRADGRYPSTFLDGSMLHGTLSIADTMAGVQTVRCTDGYHELWWNRIFYASGLGAFYHELSAVMQWGPWHEQVRSATVLVGVHDPTFPHFYEATLDQWESDEPHPQTRHVWIGQLNSP